MKIVFVSNYFNHHQKPFCEEMYRRFGADFAFVSTTVMREERKKLGYAQNDEPGYVLLSYENEQKRKAALSLIWEADVVITGGAPDNMFYERIRRGKLLFRYSERPFKKKKSCFKKAYHAFCFRKKNLFRKNNIYMLCAGAYVASDYAKLGMYKNRMYKWGYFPDVKKYDIDELMSLKKRNVIMWCGRFIDWKHPDDAIRLAQKLKESGYEFHLNMVGTGVMEEKLRQMVKEYHLEESVCFLGSMPPERVRLQMEETGIYLFTSDCQEGWGAVLNEALNSGCTVVASNTIGSVPFLLMDGKNGYTYISGSVDMLFERVKYLLDHPTKVREMGIAAYETVLGEWNAKVAAERFIRLVECIQKGEKYPVLYEDGPISKTEILKCR